MRKHTILFLAANPSDTDHLALDREARAIQVELERSRWRDCFEFVTRWAAEPLDLLIATSTSARWARAWSRVDVRRLHADAESALVASILDDGAADRLVRRIAARAAGVTVELCASAAAAYERLDLGYTVEDVEAALAEETSSSFESAWTLLSPDAQLVLQVASTYVTERFPSPLVVDALQRDVCDGLHAQDRRVEALQRAGRVEVVWLGVVRYRVLGAAMLMHRCS